MYRSTVQLALILAMTTAASAEEQTQLVDETAKLNYSVGYQIGSDFQRQQLDIRPEALIQGIRDAISKDESLLTESEMRQLMADLGKQVTEQKRQNKMMLLQARLEESRQFHATNKLKQGIVTTDSGLQYRIIEQGRGEHPGPGSKVLVNYSGKLIDGTEFDSSYKRGKPSSFKVDQVIKGWSEGLQLMTQGARWLLFVPPELAYGEAGAPPAIPPNSTLIFDVDLLAVE